MPSELHIALLGTARSGLGHMRRIANIARNGYRSPVAVMDDVCRAEPDISIDLPNMPERVNINGVEFIEFTTRGDEAKALAAMLSSMRFIHAGDYASKKVALWQHGDIRIIMNQETTGFASSAYAMHGTLVCDVGLMVEDAAATKERAIALEASHFNQPVGLGELAPPGNRKR